LLPTFLILNDNLSTPPDASISAISISFLSSSSSRLSSSRMNSKQPAAFLVTPKLPLIKA
jgi:hypothetical protein